MARHICRGAACCALYVQRSQQAREPFGAYESLLEHPSIPGGIEGRIEGAETQFRLNARRIN